MIISGKSLQTLFRVAQARSKDATKPGLSSLKVEPYAQGVNICATDGFLMAVTHLDEGVSDPIECLIPDSVLKLVKESHFSRSYGAVALELVRTDNDDTWSYFAQGSKSLITVGVDGSTKFPQWKKCVPSAEVFEKLSHLPNHGFSVPNMNAANAVLGSKKHPFNLNAALSAEGCQTAVAQQDGILILAIPDKYSEDAAEGSRLAILDNARQMGLIPYEVMG